MTTKPDYWFTHIGEIRYENQRSGHSWFSPEALRFFGCRVGRTVYGGRYFISSEQDDFVFSDGRKGAWNGARRYTIRMANADGTIETVGEFGQYATNADARRAVLEIVKAEFLIRMIAQTNEGAN
jgi:hypothetical protein